jgi:hypothetical protein
MGDGFFVYAGADQVVELPASATLNATVHYGTLDPATVALNWSLENGPATAQFGNASNEDTTVGVPIPGRYTFELSATPQAGLMQSDLVTVIFLDTYANWSTIHFGSPLAPGAGKLDDLDLDGFANLIEFVLGFDPAVADSGSLLQPTLDAGGFLTMTYFRRYVDPSVISVTAEVAGDLVTWRSGPANVSETVIGSAADGEFIRVTDLTPMASATERFLRLRVDCAP